MSYLQPAPPLPPVPEGEEGPSEDATKAKSMFTAADRAVSNDACCSGSSSGSAPRMRALQDLDMALQGGKRERSTGFTLSTSSCGNRRLLGRSLQLSGGVRIGVDSCT